MGEALLPYVTLGADGDATSITGEEHTDRRASRRRQVHRVGEEEMGTLLSRCAEIESAMQERMRQGEIPDISQLVPTSSDGGESDGSGLASDEKTPEQANSST